MSDGHFVHTQPRKMTPQSARRGTSTPVTSVCTLTFSPASGSVNTSGLSLFGPRVGRLLLFWTQETLERHVGLGGRRDAPPCRQHRTTPTSLCSTHHSTLQVCETQLKGDCEAKKKKKCIMQVRGQEAAPQ